MTTKINSKIVGYDVVDKGSEKKAQTDSDCENFGEKSEQQQQKKRRLQK